MKSFVHARTLRPRGISQTARASAADSRAFRRSRAASASRTRVISRLNHPSLHDPYRRFAAALTNGRRTARGQRTDRYSIVVENSHLLLHAGCPALSYYDPQTGQFLSVDPLVDQTHQPYSYAGGDPSDVTDPTGEFGRVCPDGSIAVVCPGVGTGTGLLGGLALLLAQVAEAVGGQKANDEQLPFRVTLEVQHGEETDFSYPYRARVPMTATQGVDELAKLELIANSTKNARKWAPCFPKAFKYIENGPTNNPPGYDPFGKGFTNLKEKGGWRVDVAIWAGRNFVTE